MAGTPYGGLQGGDMLWEHLTERQETGETEFGWPHASGAESDIVGNFQKHEEKSAIALCRHLVLVTPFVFLPERSRFFLHVANTDRRASGRGHFPR